MADLAHLSAAGARVDELLDRFGLCADVIGLVNPADRVEVLERRSAFEDDGSFAAWAQNRARHALDDAWPDKPPHDVPCECAHVGPDYCPRHTP